MTSTAFAHIGRETEVRPHPQGGFRHCDENGEEWFRGFQAEGTVATINTVEIDRDAVVLGLSVSRRAEGHGRRNRNSSTKWPPSQALR